MRRPPAPTTDAILKSAVFAHSLILALSTVSAMPLPCGEASSAPCRLHGRVEFVDAFPDYKIKFVDAFPDAKVKFVESFPDRPGR